MIEEWKTHPIYTAYEVSTLGRVRNKNGKILSPWISDRGYYKISLYVGSNPNRRKGQKNLRVHRLVLETWVGPSGLDVDHIDENKLNNNLTNLQYVTVEQNNLLYIERRKAKKSQG